MDSGNTEMGEMQSRASWLMSNFPQQADTVERALGEGRTSIASFC